MHTSTHHTNYTNLLGTKLNHRLYKSSFDGSTILSTLPVFPVFKKLELKDKSIIETFVKEHPPYSDFNFVSLWTWNTDGSTRISQLHGNLALEMKDYNTDDTIYSFLGTNKTEQSIEDLLEFAKQHHVSQLNLLPESNLHDKLHNRYQIEEDPNQFDYIYDLAELTKLEGSKYHKKRNMNQRFRKENIYDVKILDLKNIEIQEQIKNVSLRWQEHKNKIGASFRDDSEALLNAIDLSKVHDLIGVGVYINSALVGFTIGEILHNHHSMVHFQKAIKDFPGISEFLMQQTAEHHLTKGATHMNYQQDLGLEGLKRSKQLWHPATFLKKYKLSYKK